MSNKLVLPLSILFILSATLADGQIKCRKRIAISERCANPPVVSKLTIPAYTGLWYQTFTSGTASRFSANSCVTANYTLSTLSPPTIDVLNCQATPNGQRPRCVTATAKKRPNATFNSQLQVQFFPQVPPGDYNVAAIIGNPNHGYFAAAVYSCDRFPPKFEPLDGFFIISRSPYAPVFALKRLIRQLKCNGYKGITFRMFQRSVNSEQCKFISGPGSFDIVPANRSSPFDS